MSNQTYAESELYDLAFSYRDYPQEIETLIQWFKTIKRTSELPTSVLELACGPARHLLEFSANDIPSVGLDNSRNMCRYATSLMEKNDAAVQIINADMTEFNLDRSFDLILLMLNSIPHILKEDHLRSHFKSIYQHLSPNGIYVIESARVKLTPDPGGSEWREESGSDEVNVRWSWDEEFHYVHMTGSFAEKKVEVDDKFPMHHWRTSEIIDSAKAAGLILVGHFGNFNDDSATELRASVSLESNTSLHSCFLFTKWLGHCDLMT